MYKAERMFLRWHKEHFWILCHGISTKDLGYRSRPKTYVFDINHPNLGQKCHLDRTFLLSLMKYIDWCTI
jgi:hypothetical protein